MRVYKPIQIDQFDLTQQQLLSYARKHITNWSTGSIIVDPEAIFSAAPDFKKFIEQHNLVWDIARFFITEPQSSIGIHIDGTELYPKYLALNLPVLNCAGTYMKWWDNLDQVLIKDFEQYSPNIKVLDGLYKTTIDTLELLTPHLVRIDVPHNVINNTDGIRIILSVRFKPEPIELWC